MAVETASHAARAGDGPLSGTCRWVCLYLCLSMCSIVGRTYRDFERLFIQHSVQVERRRTEPAPETTFEGQRLCRKKKKKKDNRILNMPTLKKTTGTGMDELRPKGLTKVDTWRPTSNKDSGRTLTREPSEFRCL